MSPGTTFLLPTLYLQTPQDCWSLSNRDPGTNELVPDPSKFPRGIKALAHDIHALGLKIGIYRQIVLLFR
jgi:Alpha galactosidase A